MIKINNMDQVLNRMWDKLKKLSKKDDQPQRPGYHRNDSSHRKRQNSLPVNSIKEVIKPNKRYSKDDSDLIFNQFNKEQPKAIGKIKTINKMHSTSQLRFFYNDQSLKHARRRMRLAKDFDKMLEDGFPMIKLDPTKEVKKELTLFISLTPEVACGGKF